MENLRRQFEEIEVLKAIYQDELIVDSDSIESAKQQQLLLEEDHHDAGMNRISFTVNLSQLASLRGNLLKHTNPSFTVEFPPEYPKYSPPLVVKTTDLDAELIDILHTCLEDHSGEESMMKLIMSINQEIQTRNELVIGDYELGIREQEKQSESQPSKNADSKPIIGRRVINSPYILKPAKIKDIKKCADKLKLGGYAKVGKPGIIIIEGPEEGCHQYCTMLENCGWKYQKVQGEQQEEGPAGGSVDELRVFSGNFKILGKDVMSELIQLCRNAGLAEFFFTSLNMHDSVGGKVNQGSGRKGGKH